MSFTDCRKEVIPYMKNWLLMKMVPSHKKQVTYSEDFVPCRNRKRIAAWVKLFCNCKSFAEELPEF